MYAKNFLKIALLILVVSDCRTQEMDNESLIAKSINFHDPNDRWKNFKGEFLILLEQDQNLEFVLDNAKSSASWKEILKSKDTLYGGFVGDSCFVLKNGCLLPSKGTIENIFLECDKIKERTHYWIYMYGLPMKLMDNEVNFTTEPKVVPFLHSTYWMAEVNYNLNQEEEFWRFYFNRETFALEAAQFFHPALNDDSEYILFNHLQWIQGIHLPTKHSWFMKNTNDFIGDEKLVPIINED